MLGYGRDENTTISKSEPKSPSYTPLIQCDSFATRRRRFYTDSLKMKLIFGIDLYLYRFI